MHEDVESSPRDRCRAAGCDRARRARGLLPTDRRPRQRSHARSRGARPLAAPAYAGLLGTDRVHPDRREHGAHRSARPVGAARGVPHDRGVEGRRARRRLVLRQRQPVGRHVQDDERPPRRQCRPCTPPGSTAESLVLEVTETALIEDLSQAGSTLATLKTPRAADRRRRLRHRLLVARLPEQLPARHHQARQVVRRSRRQHRRRRDGWCARSSTSPDTLGLTVIAEGVEQPEQAKALDRPRVSARTGVPLRPADAGRGPRVAAEGAVRSARWHNRVT